MRGKQKSEAAQKPARGAAKGDAGAAATSKDSKDDQIMDEETKEKVPRLSKTVGKIIAEIKASGETPRDKFTRLNLTLQLEVISHQLKMSAELKCVKSITVTGFMMPADAKLMEIL